MPIVGDPQGTQARALDVEREHPGHGDVDAPPAYRWRQLLAVLVVVVFPIVACLLLQWWR
ncbi:MAG TPA: hypothetical protein VFG89_02235 [Coriobacteriia bacterium]|nr:hypothetical protein [Coriobacteriia bacterium]